MNRTAAIYVRVSTREQAESGDSIPAQRERLRKWAAENGYRIVEEYVDAGESARVSDRPAFLRLVQDAKAKKFDAVLIWKWDRWARNAEDAALYKALLRRELGVDVIAVGDPVGEGPVGTLIERILDVIAEFQSLMTAEHVYNTMTYLAQQGKWLSGPPFGYRIGEDGKLEPDPETAEAARWIFEEAAKGRALRSITRALVEGKPWPCTAGRKWSVTGVRKLLTNPAYIGSVVWNRRTTEVVPTLKGSRKKFGVRDESEWIVVENAHEPLVSRELWNTVQAMIQRPSPKRSKNPHPLKGLVRCAQCGGPFSFHATYSKTPRWVCTRYYRVQNPCRPVNSILHPDLVRNVKDVLRAFVEGREKTPDNLTWYDPHATKRERALERVKERKERLTQAYLAGAFELEDFMRLKKELDEEASRLAASAQDHDIGELRDRLRDVARAALEALENPAMDPEEAAGRVRRCIRQVIVDRRRKRVTIEMFSIGI